MRLGIGSYAFAWAIGVPGHAPRRPMNAFELLNAATELGVGLVQICDNLPLDALDEAELVRLGDVAAERGIELEIGTRGIRPAHLQQYLALALRLKARLLRTVIDTAEHRPALPEVIAALRSVEPEFRRQGVCLAIENHDRFTARQFASVGEAVASPAVGICLDTVNSFGALEGPAVVLDALVPWVACLHVKDFTIRRAEHQMGFVIEGTPAGQGRLDFPPLLERLQTADRRPNAILEQWPPPEATLEATIAKERRWAHESIHCLRRWICD